MVAEVFTISQGLTLHLAQNWTAGSHISESGAGRRLELDIVLKTNQAWKKRFYNIKIEAKLVKGQKCFVSIAPNALQLQTLVCIGKAKITGK